MLRGNGGDDRLQGGAGNDRLTGGSGVDHFIFDGSAAEGTDRITDFANGIDRLEISGATIFSDLAIAIVNGNTEIVWNANAIVLLGETGVIDAGNFDFV